MDTVIEVNDLQRTFNGRRAVDGLSFQVGRGEVFGLLGPNGAGKTTTVRLLNGLLPPSGGSARLFGLDPQRAGGQVRRRAGVLTENPCLYERLTARENLTFFATLAEVPPVELPGRVDEQLRFFDLVDRADERVGNFSKGMKQRLALARALIHQPELLFFDEPTSGLDPESALQVVELIERHSRREGQTVVLCTHNLPEAQRLCDRVGIMNNGRFLAVGSLPDLARDLWPATWLDVELLAEPQAALLAALRRHPDVLAVEPTGNRLAVQLTRAAAVSEVVRLLAKSADLVRLNPRQYTLEEIYFTLQNRKA